MTDGELEQHIAQIDGLVTKHPDDAEPLKVCLAMARRDKRRRLDQEPPSAAGTAQPPPGCTDWTIMHKFKVGNMSANTQWSNRPFDEVYQNADPKAWQWMLKPTFNATAKWCAQFVAYVKGRSLSEGRSFAPEATAQAAQAAMLQTDYTATVLRASDGSSCLPQDG